MKTLQVDGRELSPQHEAKPIPKPTEGVAFDVNPSGIDRSLFETERKDSEQETTRQFIQEAFAEVDNNPEKYGKPFKTLMPRKTRDWKTVGELEELAAKLGGHMADWVEQALEWAQRIHNSESWEAICNEDDTANWYRLVKWKNGYVRTVGGSCEYNDYYPASHVHYFYYYPYDSMFYAVPLIAL